jgi:DNA-binding MarR family transcriptional regulator
MLENEMIINDLMVETFNKIMNIEAEELKYVCNKYNVSIKEIHTLEKIFQNNNSSMSAVADSLKITRGSFTIAIKTLEKKGYAKRTKSKIDSRSYNVHITKKGLEIHDYHMQFHKKMITKVISNTDIVDQEILIESLKRLITFFKELEVKI